jgi:hypothetical protein
MTDSLEERACVWFPKLSAAVRSEEFGFVSGGGHVAGREMPRAAVTLLAGPIMPPAAQRSARTREGITPYIPSFWRTRALGASLTIAAQGVVDPRYLVFGMYALERSGKHLPDNPFDPSWLSQYYSENVIDVLLSRPHFLVPLLYICDSTSNLILPGDQGYGNTPGARIAVYEGVAQVRAIRAAWLTQLSQANAPVHDRLFSSDDMAPAGCRGWLCPYGEEDREFASVAVAGMRPEEIASHIAALLSLPLIGSDATDEQLLEWHFEDKLPPGVPEALDAL